MVGVSRSDAVRPVVVVPLAGSVAEVDVATVLSDGRHVATEVVPVLVHVLVDRPVLHG